MKLLTITLFSYSFREVWEENHRWSLCFSEQSRTEQSRAGKGRAEQDRAEQDRAEQSRTEQDRAEQSRKGQSRTEQSRTEQSRKGQSRAEQSRAEQERAEQGRAGQGRAGEEESDRKQLREIDKNEGKDGESRNHSDERTYIHTYMHPCIHPSHDISSHPIPSHPIVSTHLVSFSSAECLICSGTFPKGMESENLLCRIAALSRDTASDREVSAPKLAVDTDIFGKGISSILIPTPVPTIVPVPTPGDGSLWLPSGSSMLEMIPLERTPPSLTSSSSQQ